MGAQVLFSPKRHWKGPIIGFYILLNQEQSAAFCDRFVRVGLHKNDSSCRTKTDSGAEDVELGEPNNVCQWCKKYWKTTTKNTVCNIVVASLAALTQILALKKKMLFGYYWKWGGTIYESTLFVHKAKLTRVIRIPLLSSVDYKCYGVQRPKVG